MEGACYDLDYARETVASVTSVSQFVKVSELLASAIHLKKQLEERQAQNAHFMETGNSSTSPLSSKTVSHEGAIGESLIITPKSFD